MAKYTFALYSDDTPLAAVARVTSRLHGTHMKFVRGGVRASCTLDGARVTIVASLTPTNSTVVDIEIFSATDVARARERIEEALRDWSWRTRASESAPRPALEEHATL